LKNAIDQLKEIVYIPIQKFSGFSEMNSLGETHALASSLCPSEYEVKSFEARKWLCFQGAQEEFLIKQFFLHVAKMSWIEECTVDCKLFLWAGLS
jgi:hypothetical protein